MTKKINSMQLTLHGIFQKLIRIFRIFFIEYSFNWECVNKCIYFEIVILFLLRKYHTFVFELFLMFLGDFQLLGQTLVFGFPQHFLPLNNIPISVIEGEIEIHV